MSSALATFAGDLKRSFLDLATIVGVILAFQLVVLRTIPADWQSMLIGLCIVAVGLALFMRGLEIGMFPLGEELATHLAHGSRRFWLIVFAFVIGFSTAVAEPALIAIAHKAVAISNGVIDGTALRVVVGLSVGLAVVIGVCRILWQHPIHWYFIAGYLITLALTPFAPSEIIGIAYDSGGVTTSTITVPMLAALGIGLATALKSKNPVIDGFGLVSFAALIPIIFVQVYGMVVFAPGAVTVHAQPVIEILAFGGSLLAAAATALPLALGIARDFLYSTANLVPVVGTIAFFFVVVLRKHVDQFPTRLNGFILVALGLYAFVVGLEVGLFPIGESISVALAESGNLLALYLFAFSIGFATTVAEPSLTAVAQKAQEISGGALNATILRVVVAVGVGVGILLGAYRIVNGDLLGFYIIAGYAVVIALTFFAPRTIVPIAFDSGGVTTSTVTVPILAALGLGLATTIPGRDPLVDGFGLIALASIFPILTVLMYGIGQQQNIRRHERYIASLAETALTHVADKHSAEHRIREARIRKPIVTITGTPGSGATSVSKRVSELLHYRYFSTGEIFRKIASEREVSLDALNKAAENESHIDYEIDLVVQTLGEHASRIVINSRLGYHWIHNSFKVFLTVPIEVAAERTFRQIKHEGRIGERARSLGGEAKTIEKRITHERERYLGHYGVDTGNLKPFNLVIDTNTRDVEDVAREIVAAYTAWIGTKR